MSPLALTLKDRVALVTGVARRIGFVAAGVTFREKGDNSTVSSVECGIPIAGQRPHPNEVFPDTDTDSEPDPEPRESSVSVSIEDISILFPSAIDSMLPDSDKV